MASVLTKSLKERFADLQREREKSWTPAQLAANAGQRRRLVDRFDPHALARIGDKLPATRLANVEGGHFTIRDVTARGSAVLIFFRFATCPACNIALRYYEEALWPTLRARGIPLVALSPQRPDLLGEIRQRQALSFIVATDPESGLADYLGISFLPEERPSPPPAGWIGEVTGTGSWSLPQPTVAIVDRDQTIRFLHVSPDWLDRPEAEAIITALDQIA